MKHRYIVCIYTHFPFLWVWGKFGIFIFLVSDQRISLFLSDFNDYEEHMLDDIHTILSFFRTLHNSYIGMHS